MHKRTLYSTIFTFLIIVLAACSNKTDEVEPSQTDQQNQQDIPLETKLMIGSVKLDETDHVIDAEQASNLIPLWKALRSLASSDTTAEAEVNAVINQIQDTMTTDQLALIDEMELTMGDMGSVFGILGIENTFGGRFGDITPEMQATMEAMRESGEFPAGGQGLGRSQGQRPGDDGVGGAEIDPSVRETAIAERGGEFGRGFGINTQLLDAIIEFLEEKIQ